MSWEPPLVCPLTHAPLRREGEWLVSDERGLRYPIREGIPVLLPEEAQLPAGAADLNEFLRQRGLPRVQG
jgi:uncharacterized protein YbaR (Trm112 family)